MEIMKEALSEAFQDSLAMLPFLFAIYLILELFEHRFSHKTIGKNKFGPVIGSAVGIFPQCGFSIAATTLFNQRIITVGTLMAVYLSTSDEAIPILLARPDQFFTVLKIIGVKLIIGIFFGLLLDQFIKPEAQSDCLCTSPHEAKEDGSKHTHSHSNNLGKILWHSLKKTLQIFGFLLAIMVVLNFVIAAIGEDHLAKLLSSGSIFQPFLCGLIGLIPTCAPSILITQLFLDGILPFGSTIAGLCASSGMGIILLLKENPNPKQVGLVLLLLYGISTFSGILLNFMQI